MISRHEQRLVDVMEQTPDLRFGTNTDLFFQGVLKYEKCMQIGDRYICGDVWVEAFVGDAQTALRIIKSKGFLGPFLRELSKSNSLDVNGSDMAARIERPWRRIMSNLNLLRQPKVGTGNLLEIGR